MNRCIVCNSNLTDKDVILTLNDMPASAQNIPDKDDLKDDTGITLSLCRCKTCGLVQFNCKPVSYYKDVIRAGGSSTTMIELRKKQYRHLIETYHLEGKKIVEVGCGQGEFLKILTEFPVNAYGMENNGMLAESARNNGLNVFKGFAGDSVIWENGPFDAFLSFNFLEHQPAPNEMLQGIYNNLVESGIGLITVPSFEYILRNDGYYELIRDHIAYYTFGSLTNLLERNHFEILEQSVVNRDTLSVIVRKAPVKPEEKLKSSFHLINKDIDRFVDRLKQEGKSLAMWGAGHQGFTIASTTQLKNYISYIVDSADFKQNRYAPSSHLPIVPPEVLIHQPVDAVLIAAPGYTEEIRSIIINKMKLHMDIFALRSNYVEAL